jgi:phosphoribosyl 1,2-cyclic phosphate phosphodiesterase
MPVIACHCHGCTSHDKRDKRLRCSAYICQRENHGVTTRIVIDTGPEFRIQALKYKIPALNAVLLTHSHADHLHGLDDLRIFSHTEFCPGCKGSSVSYPETHGQGLPIYTNAEAIEDVKNRFDYVFKKTQEGGGKPRLVLIDCAAYSGSQPLMIGSVSVIPVPMMHGELPTAGWLLGCTARDGTKHSVAYLTDCNYISPESVALLKEFGGTIDHVVIDGLRVKSHSTHCSFDEAMAYASRIGGRHTWFTHICHDMRHIEIIDYIRSRLGFYPSLEKIVSEGGSVEPACDGLVLKIGEDKTT